MSSGATDLTKSLSTGATSLSKSVSTNASDLVVTAMSMIGIPYRWGGASADTGFDCSGLIRHVFEASAGLLLPRTAAEQAKATALARVDKEDLQPGDLVFFNTRKTPYSHVGVYVGEGKFLHAPRSGAEIRVETMEAKYWESRFNGARRATKFDAQLEAVSAFDAERLDRMENPLQFGTKASSSRVVRSKGTTHTTRKRRS